MSTTRYVGETRESDAVFPVGCYADEDEWSIVTDAEFFADYHTACPHATRKDNLLVVPRVVSGRNEGGYCSVEICLDCILEAVK